MSLTGFSNSGKVQLGSIASSVKDVIPGVTVEQAAQDTSRLSGAIGKLSSVDPLRSLAETAKTAGVLTPVASPLVTAAAARASYRAAIVAAQARQDEVTAVAYRQVFDAIRSASSAGISSITLVFNSQQQSEILPLLQRNGYAITVGAAIANTKSQDNVEIKWS
jgi:hypothetical protein